MAIATSKAPAYKRDEVAELTALLRQKQVLGIVSITGIPASQLMRMRKTLSGSVTVRVTKNTLLQLALKAVEKERPGLIKLGEGVHGPVALVATDLNPFKLYKEMERTKTPSPAKGGEKAPQEITIAAGETSFKPGPIVGELGKVGIPAGIEGGKVVIKKDKVVVKAGDTISKDLATMLSKLEIFPLEVGLDLRLAWEKGQTYQPAVLSIDEAAVLAQVRTAAARAMALALGAAYPTKASMPLLVVKAHREALAVALDAGFVSKGTLPHLLGRAARVAAVLNSVITGEPLPSAAPAGRSGGDASPKKEEPAAAVSEDEAAAGLGSLFG